MKLQMKHGLTLIFLLFVVIFSKGQNSASIFRSNPDFSDSNSRKLIFRLENIEFLKNNEYTGDIATGYTLLGGWLRPKLVYYPSEKLRVEAGGHFLRYHGSEDFERSSFWFSASYKPFNEFLITLGNLNNNENHHLIRQVFEPEQYLTEKPEAGIQFLFKNSWFNADMWLNWEQFIMQDDPFQEHFTFGWSSDLQMWSDGLSRVSLPLQFLATHKGGQIDTSPLPVQTIMNSAFGVSYSKDIRNLQFKQWGANVWYVGYKYASGTKQFVFDNGNGFLLDVFIDTNYGKFTGGYWNGHDFIAPKGMRLFQSVSSKIDDFSVSNREMISFNYDFSKEVVEGANFGISAETYYDLGDKSLSYVWGFFLTFNESFFIKSL